MKGGGGVSIYYSRISAQSAELDGTASWWQCLNKSCKPSAAADVGYQHHSKLSGTDDDTRSRGACGKFAIVLIRTAHKLLTSYLL